ncbi:protein MULTIPOLAR SPINDLE 1 isoform X2 [Trifolium pratense]|uniref:protein MULTIPOLAR SPINDLE 1 isoform X2 n=1 Tax=Trifolium pratense TaxID=57577 RepID=UPI001E695589|nr:protein MULTIPOLAR SPINDLE 1 isoform X2 [Trifolium pratense]
MADAGNRNTAASDESIKLAVAVSLLRSKFIENSNAISPSQSEALLRWKRKAKERKQEILRLREDLKETQDASHCDLFPENASCKCYFFDNLGQLSPKRDGNDSSNNRFNDVLRRRFLRQVRFKERRRRIGSSSSSSQQRISLGLAEEDETEQLKASVDFLVELCETVSSVDDSKFANLAHQSVDFILGSQHSDTSAQFCIQHLVRKLGSEPYIGQRAILSVCQKILVLAERLLFSDPFDDTFPDMHECMFIMIQLIEFLVADYLLEWSKAEDFDTMLLEDWMMSIIQARKALELLESRNGLYSLYMDRVTGELAKHVGGISLLQKIKPDIFNRLFC